MQRIEHRLLPILAVVLAVLVTPVKAIPTGFLDLGSTTVDQNSGLEWLDVTVTRARQVSSVLHEINNSGVGALSDSDWRYATLTEARTLVSTWFGFNYTGGSVTNFPGANTSEVTDFINTFGDIFRDARLISQGLNFDVVGGSSKGYVDTGAGSITNEFEVSAFEFTNLDTGAFTNAPDFITDIHHTGYADIWKGSFLVRNYAGAASSVSEPGSLMLLTLGAMAARRARRKN